MSVYNEHIDVCADTMALGITCQFCLAKLRPSFMNHPGSLKNATRARRVLSVAGLQELQRRRLGDIAVQVVQPTRDACCCVLRILAPCTHATSDPESRESANVDTALRHSRAIPPI